MREGDWQVAPPPRRPAGPPRRDHRPGRPQDGDQRAQLGREASSWPTSRTRTRRPGRTASRARRTSSTRSSARSSSITPDKSYRLNEETATLLVRPRGWHLVERHLSSTASRSPASSSTSASTSSTTARRLLERGSGPYFYLPKLESHLEARLWNDVFASPRTRSASPRGCIRATVLIETILAAFEMEEILYELREHSAGLNAGRWDYIFSVIKKFRHRPEFVLPDRAAVTMAVPFMRAYTELLVQDVPPPRRARDRRHGGVHPLAPRPRGERGRAREGERGQGARGRATASTAPGSRTPTSCRWRWPCFDGVLGERPNQVGRQRGDVVRRAPADLLDVAATPGEVTEAGLRNERLRRHPVPRRLAQGSGAVAIYNLMEDAATVGDLTLAGLAVAPPRARRARGRRAADRARRSRKLDADVSEARDAVRAGRPRRRVRRVPDAARVRAPRLRDGHPLAPAQDMPRCLTPGRGACGHGRRGLKPNSSSAASHRRRQTRPLGSRPGVRHLDAADGDRLPPPHRLRSGRGARTALRPGHGSLIGVSVSSRPFSA